MVCEIAASECSSKDLRSHYAVLFVSDSSHATLNKKKKSRIIPNYYCPLFNNLIMMLKRFGCEVRKWSALALRDGKKKINYK